MDKEIQLMAGGLQVYRGNNLEATLELHKIIY